MRASLAFSREVVARILAILRMASQSARWNFGNARRAKGEVKEISRGSGNFVKY